MWARPQNGRLAETFGWIAQATINGAHFVLGTWANAEEAATAFDRVVLHYRGAGARVAPGDCSPRAGPLNESLPWWLFTKRPVGSVDRTTNSAKKSRRRYSGTSDRSTRYQCCQFGNGLRRAHMFRAHRRRALQVFSPAAGKAASRKARHRPDHADGRQAGTSLRGFVHHRAPGRRTRADQMVTPMPTLSPKVIRGATRCTCP